MENILIVVIFGFVSLILIAIGVFLWFTTKRFAENATQTTGTVIALAEHHSSDSGTTYSPIVRFRAMDGREVEFTESMSSNPPGYVINEQVPVLYDPSNYQKARVFKSTWRLYFAPLLLGGMGILFLIIDFGLLVAFGSGILSDLLK